MSDKLFSLSKLGDKLKEALIKVRLKIASAPLPFGRGRGRGAATADRYARLRRANRETIKVTTSTPEACVPSGSYRSRYWPQ